MSLLQSFPLPLVLLSSRREDAGPLVVQKSWNGQINVLHRYLLIFLVRKKNILSAGMLSPTWQAHWDECFCEEPFSLPPDIFQDFSGHHKSMATLHTLSR